MKVHLCEVNEPDLFALLTERARNSKAGHALVPDPSAADMILLVGNFGADADLLLKHPAYVAFPDKCAAYTEDDYYLPLIPGVYCSAHNDEHARAGRVFSYAYISRNGKYSNVMLTREGAAQKKYLFAFQGGSTSLLRKRMFNLDFRRPDVVIENTSSYHRCDMAQPDRLQRQRRYAETLAASHFVLCPRGSGVGSIRLFEVMCAGVAPVLIADDYLLPPHIEWDRFLLRIPERSIGRLPQLIEPHVSTSAERGRLAWEAYRANFLPEIEFDRVVDYCFRALHHGSASEATFRHRTNRMIARAKLQRRMRALARDMALKAMKNLQIKNPYQMNRP
jgi:hypothetical protein